MPSEPMNIQEQGFRSSLFGFDKNDVLAYMNALANEAQQHELEYNRQLQQLQSKLDELRSERGTADSRMEALKAELAAATQRADTAERRTSSWRPSRKRRPPSSPPSGNPRKTPTSGS